MNKMEQMEKLYRALASEADALCYHARRLDFSDASLDTMTKYVKNINRIKRELWETWLR